VSALLASLLALESGTGTQADVYARLLEDRVLIPLAEPTQFMTVPTDDGRLALPVFSDARTMAVWGEPPGSAWVDSAELLRFVAFKGVSVVVIDPAGPVRATLADGELAALAAGRVPSEEDVARVPKPLADEHVTVGPLDVPLEEPVLELLREALATTGVRTAWLLEGVRSGLRRTLVLVLEGEDAEAAVPKLAEAVVPVLAAVASVRFTVAEPGERLERLRAETEPVYAR
jgi:SseB protein N-terminal domain